MTQQAKQNRKIHFASWMLPLAVFILLAALQFSEWWRIGVLADPTVIAKYPFGAEGPVAGDPAYKSAEAYAQYTLRGWITCFFIVVLFTFAGLRHSRTLLWVGYAFAAIAFLVSLLL